MATVNAQKILWSLAVRYLRKQSDRQTNILMTILRTSPNDEMTIKQTNNNNNNNKEKCDTDLTPLSFKFTTAYLTSLGAGSSMLCQPRLGLITTEYTDIEKICLNTKWAIGIWHLWLKHFNSWWKDVKNLICYSCIFNVQQHVHLKKWTSKFKLLYLRNYISYFNKICRICCVNTHIQSLKVWLKSILSWLKYSIFSTGLFLLAHPVGRCRYICRCLQCLSQHL